MLRFRCLVIELINWRATFYQNRSQTKTNRTCSHTFTRAWHIYPRFSWTCLLRVLIGSQYRQFPFWPAKLVNYSGFGFVILIQLKTALCSLRTQTYFRLSLVPPKIASANSSHENDSVTSALINQLHFTLHIRRGNTQKSCVELSQTRVKK